MIPPTRRDRDARATAAVARACGFTQPVAPLVLRHVQDVETLLRRDDATLRRVLGDPSLRASLREGVVAAFRDTWKRAAMDRLRLDHQDWLRAWWLPVCTDRELDHLLAAPTPRADHRRVGIARAGFPTTVGAAEVLSPEDLRRVVGDYLVVERRVAVAVLDLAAEVAAEERRPRPRPTGTATIDDPPPEASEATGTAWWHPPPQEPA